MKITFTTIVLIFVLKSFSQINFIGIKGGLDWMTADQPYQHSYSEIYKKYYRQGLTGGFTYEHVDENSFSFSTGILYNQRGYKYDERWYANNGGYVICYDSNGNLIGDKLRYDYRFSYLSIPIKIGFRFGKRLTCSIHAGLLPSLLIGTKKLWYSGNLDFVNGTGQVDLVETNTSAKTLNLPGIGSIGSDYKLKERIWLTMDFSYQHDITRINESKDKPIKLYGMTVNLGVKLALRKKE